MTRIKIFYLVNEFADGSSNNLILTLLRGMDPSCFEYHVGGLKAIRGPLEAHFTEAGATVVSFGLSAGKPGLGGLRRIAGYIEQNQIHVVHTHVLRPDILGGLAARLAHRPAVLSTKHNMAYVRSQNGWLMRNLFYWPAMYLSDQIVTVTEALRQQTIERLRISPTRVTTIHNGIDAERYYQPDARAATRAALGLAPDAFVLTYTGRLIGGKGLEEVLRAAQPLVERHPACRVLIVGEGELQERLQQLAGELGLLSHVVFAGFRRDVPEVLAASDVFVLPSFSEGLPLSVLEAMAAGKPVVVSRVGGVPEIVHDGETGLMIRPGDVPGLTAALLSLIEDPARRTALGARGRQHVQEHFSVPSMIARYQDLYQAYAVDRLRRQL